MEKIKFFFEDTSKEWISKKEIRSLIKRITEDYNLKAGMLNIVFCRDEFLLEINKKFLNHDYYTDIVTFENHKNDFVGGELYISMERVIENAEKYGETFEHEIVRVVIHGILHLVGKCDKTKEESNKMREEEDYYLKIYKEMK